MPAHPPPLAAPLAAPFPGLRAALDEVLGRGLAVVRLAARLAEIENAALDIVAAQVAEAARAAMTEPDSLEQAIAAGHGADASEAIRDASAVRVASIAHSFDKAARAVRRTAALQARLADPHPFGRAPAAPIPRPATPTARHPDRDRGSAERPDRPEDGRENGREDGCEDGREDGPENGDELGTRTNGQVLHAIHRDLAEAVLPAGWVPAHRLVPGLPVTPPAPLPQPSLARPRPSTQPPFPVPPAIPPP